MSQCHVLKKSSFPYRTETISLSLSFFFSSNFPPIESVLQVAIKVIFKNHASYDMSSMLKILQ